MSPTPRPGPRETSLTDLVGGLADTVVVRGDDTTGVTGVTHSSADVRPGDLFAALPGERTHGIRFIDEAIRNGAVAVLSDETGAAEARGLPVIVAPHPRAVLGDIAAQVYGRPADDLTVIGVTGTNGKTTVTYLLEAGLAAAGLSTGLIGTTGIHIGGMHVPSARTTPEAPDLHATLAVMRDAGVQAVAMEVSSHALALGRVDGIRFACSIFTNLSQDHLDFHRDMEDYFAVKASLFEQRRSRQAVIAVDDGWGRRLATSVDIPVTTVGLDHPADVECLGIDSTEHADHVMRVAGTLGAATITLALPGRFNASNALLAWAALRNVGVSGEAASAGLAEVTVPGRMESVDAGQRFAVIVDYAHSPDAVARVISDVDVPMGSRRIVVLGCGGDRDVDKRAEMGRVAAELADIVVATDDNPRSEDPAAIRRQMVAGIPPGSTELVEIGDRREAIRAAIRMARDGDVVLILGKGHESGQEIGGVVRPFDDRVEARAALTGVAS